MADIKNHSTLPTNLVSYWDFEEASGTRYDLVGNADLTDNNTVTTSTGNPIGNGAKFTRANSESLSTTGTSTDITGDVSFSCWVKFTTLTNNELRPFFGKDGTSNRSYGSWLYLTGGVYTLRFWISSNGTAGSEHVVTWSTPTTGVWYHIVGTWDASTSTAEFFVNGSSIGTNASALTSIYNGDTPFYIGRFGEVSGDYTDAEIDEFGLWSKVLTSDEITDLYNSGSGLPYYDPADISNDTDLSTSLVSFWEMEEATGATRTDSTATGNDLSNASGASGIVTVTGIQGSGADIEKSDSEYLVISDAAQTGLDLGASGTDFSFNVWCNLEDLTASGGVICSLWSCWDASGRNVIMGLASSTGTKMRTVIRNAADNASDERLSDALTFSTSTWYMLTWTYDASAGTIQMFQNGVLITSVTGLYTSLNNSSYQKTIGDGASPTAYSPDGIIDEVGIWSKVLGVDEIRALYGYGTPPVYSATSATNTTNFFYMT